MKDPIKTELTLTADQARRRIKRQPAGTHFAVHLRSDAPIEGDPGKVFPDGCSCSLVISKKQALKLPAQMLHKVLEDRGGRLRVQILEWPADDVIRDKNSRWVYIGG